MTTKELDLIETLKKILSNVLIEADQKEKEISPYYAIGLYRGTIQSVIDELNQIKG